MSHGPPEPSTRTDLSRREALRRGAAALATGTAVGTAGCLSSLPPLGGSLSYGRLDVPPADEPAYRRWLPTPEAFDTRYDDGYAFAYAEPGPYVARAPRTFRARRAYGIRALDYFGVGYENFDRLVSCDLGTVLEGEFDRDTVTATLADSGYASEGSYRGFDLYGRRDTRRRAAVGDGVLVWTSERTDDHPDLELLVDTGAGDRRRYHEGSEAFAAVSEAAGASRQLVAGPYSMDPRDYSEFGIDAVRLGEDAAYQVLVMRFADGRTPSKGALESAFRESHRLTEARDGTEVTVDGQLATVAARAPFASPVDPTPPEDPPQVTWGADYDADAEALTLRHEAGDPVPGSWLQLDFADEPNPNEVEHVPVWEGVDRVEPGDTATVDLADRPTATAVSLLLSDGDSGIATLFRYELPR
ncbi:hypothetical protein [Haloarcula litorea]|uniref:hypothetical protein n=1 Tax=Haloarcula litorea TaxID=3032579 RepID=UPI0023E79DDA|nr:hypothetical protein [Halomicroarcula sp. GDY20]